MASTTKLRWRVLVCTTAFDADKAARLGGKFWIRTRHTATGRPLPEELCPHFQARRAAAEWALERAVRRALPGTCAELAARLKLSRTTVLRVLRRAEGIDRRTRWLERKPGRRVTGHTYVYREAE